MLIDNYKLSVRNKFIKQVIIHDYQLKTHYHKHNGGGNQ